MREVLNHHNGVVRFFSHLNSIVDEEDNSPFLEVKPFIKLFERNNKIMEDETKKSKKTPIKDSTKGRHRKKMA
ncbi:hypothetical protein GE061_005605 [Apolygus lucorum]|uniref:Uncharacterized protein n=1 Tax=Apolygus lucorum TaxID=248454 RepID=A0A6A4IRM0_APOLU|nr:hypothetical protein GE061_005605 [Apolygus lucorum]